MPNVGPLELIVVLIIALVIFGPKRLPELGRSMGKGIREFKKSITDVDRSLREPERDARVERDYAADRLQNSARDVQQEEARPEPKRLLN